MSEQVDRRPREAGPGDSTDATRSIEVTAHWPWGLEPASSELIQRFEGTLVGWDRHVASCRECLHQGRWFCPDGESLTRQVAAARDRLAVPVQPRRTVSVSLAVGRSVTWQLTATLP